MVQILLGNIPRFHAERKLEGTLALSYPDGALTWRELESAANRRARWLQTLGVGEGDWVTVAAPNSCFLFQTTFALWKLGAIVNVVSPRLPAHELRAILELAKPRLVIAAEVSGVEAAPINADVSAFDDTPVEAAPAPCWKAMTSGGSTGRPKLIVDHMPAVYDTERLQYLQRPEWPVLTPGPLYHNAPFTTSHLALFVGAPVIGMDRFDAEEALRLIEAHDVGWTCMVPTMMHRIWSLPPEVRARYDLSSLRVVMHVASAIAPWLKRAWIDWLGPERIFEIYGGTEGQGQTHIAGAEWLERPGSVGCIQGQSALKILREDGSECAVGEIGEIYLRPPDPEAPPYHYVGAEPRRLDGGWDSLGDMGYVDEDGYLFLADRRTDLILRGGANIYPAEVEAAIDGHPAIASSIVLGLPDEALGQRVHAIVQPVRPGTLDLAELMAYLASRLARYKVPESYELADAPLRDDAGKARRTALRQERIDWLTAGREFRLRPQMSSA